ncbi:MAG: thiamine pyrophosphate-dependent dehydrogenase E1 component subunit alpha [Thermoleophilia bacterium]|nr:thiamine pyrophosphate-dependent dehydrogenase E1 component subunit alpha [Thermoleophilia bacterium]
MGAEAEGDVRDADDLETHRALLAAMWLARAFEERVSELFSEGLIDGLLHLGIGQEAVSVGGSTALDARDLLYVHHRAHGHAVARGADLARLLAELAGRATGYCGGKGGSMHIAAPEVGVMTASGIVGGQIPLALGAALVCQRAGDGRVAACFFGDGAGQTGSFHESLNLAALWRLPAVLICENNGWAEFTPLSAHTPVERLARHAETYGIDAVTVDGNDVLAVRDAVAGAAERARGGDGPAFVECLTKRLRGHYEGDPARYRELSAVAEWKRQDPLQRFQRLLAEHGGGGDLEEYERAARARVDAAAREALAAPWPDAGEVMTDVDADA